MTTKVLDSSANGLDRRQDFLTGISMGDGLVAFSILLVGKIEMDTGGIGKDGLRDDGAIDRGGVSDLEGGILQSKRCVVIFVVSVLSRSQKVEITNNKHIADS